MKLHRNGFLIFFLCFSFVIPSTTAAQEPDLSGLRGDKEKIKTWLSYCDSMLLNSSGARNNFSVLQKAALRGVALTPATDAADRSRFFFYAGFGCYYQVKFDSAQYFFYQSLYEARRANAAEFIANACVALIPINFQLQQQDKVDSCKEIFQSIMDTTQNKKIQQDGYSAMGSYYQQKSYYSTAQDYLLKSIELRKKQVDTTHDNKLKADYAIQCYMLSKQYQNTDLNDKSLAILKEGQPFAAASPLVDTRYLSSFTEVYSLLGNIDSALYYETVLEEHTKNSPTVPSEMVSANMNIANYYINNKQFASALPFVNKADTLAEKSKNPILLYQAQMEAGRYFEETGNPQQAISLLTQSLLVAKRISKEQYADGLKYMAVAQKKMGNADAALKYYEQYVEQSDTLTKEKISRNFADQETRYQTNQKELRIISLDKENRLKVLELQNAYRTRLLLVLGLIASGVIALLLYFIYRNKEKINKVLNKQNDQLEELNRQLAVANETKAKLFGIIGHDLRSPVSRIVQLLQLQKEKPGLINAEAQQRHEQKLTAASENVLETMEDLLLWSKSQMQHFTPQYGPVNLYNILQKELSLVNPLAEDKKLKIAQQIPGNLLQHTDENFVTVIIRNLLQNAVKYSDEGSTISIMADGQALYISNQCEKAHADVLNTKVHNTQVDSKGSGLGLQIANDLATSIHAKIFFSQPDDTTLTATLSWENHG